MRRILDWAFYPGILCLAAAVAQQLFVPAHGWLWWPLVIAGVVLVAASLVPRLLDSREALGTRTVRFGVNTAIAIVLVLGIATLVEALSYRHNARLDLTENRRHSLSPQTIQILQKLEQPVQAVAFYRADQPNKRVAEDLFKQYARHSNGKFTWRSVDPDREPTLARGYGVEAYGTTVLESKGRTEKVLDAEQEEKLTNALVRVTREGKRVVYFLQGHGERDLASSEPQGYSQVKEALERANYEVKTLALARDAKVPDDAAVVVIGGPRTDYFPPEIDALDAYLGRG
ncbi:MAG TPA: GldG family protein, partial [Candidatus Tectomicrobia bacterium]|nr:GldG family protein [Candidatus Tectomicrobia bacterium]